MLLICCIRIESFIDNIIYIFSLYLSCKKYVMGKLIVIVIKFKFIWGFAVFFEVLYEIWVVVKLNILDFIGLRIIECDILVLLEVS